MAMWGEPWDRGRRRSKRESVAGVPLAGVLLARALLAGVPLAGVPLAGAFLAGALLAGVPLPRRDSSCQVQKACGCPARGTGYLVSCALLLL